MKSSNILYQLHIVWYESQMINETLDSVKKALDHCKKSVNVKVCLNSQTYIEDPKKRKLLLLVQSNLVMGE